MKYFHTRTTPLPGRMTDPRLSFRHPGGLAEYERGTVQHDQRDQCLDPDTDNSEEGQVDETRHHGGDRQQLRLARNHAVGPPLLQRRAEHRM